MEKMELKKELFNFDCNNTGYKSFDIFKNGDGDDYEVEYYQGEQGVFEINIYGICTAEVFEDEELFITK